MPDRVVDPATDRHGPPTPLAAFAAQRVSDREREQVVEHLRTATRDGCLTLDEFAERVGVAWEARTHGELVPLTADLPPAASAASTVDPNPRPSARTRRRRLVNLFGGAHHAGDWNAEPQMTVVALFGHSHVDLSACRLDPGLTTIDLRTIGLCAGVELVVPPGSVVDASGFVLFGGRQLRHDGPAGLAQPGLRVRVRSFGAFGGLLVRSPRTVP